MLDLFCPLQCNGSVNTNVLIEPCICISRSWDAYCHFFAVVNSSGMGKTRTALELLKTYGFKGVYLLCTNIHNGWDSNMTLFCDTFAATDECEKDSLCYRFLESMVMIIENEPNLFDRQFDVNTGELKTDFLLRARNSNSSDAEITPSKRYGFSMRRETDTTNTEPSSDTHIDSSAVYTTASKKETIKVIILDEAHGLTIQNDTH